MEITVCIILIVLFVIIALICALKDEPMAATFAGFFAVIMMVILYFAIKDSKESQEPVYEVSYPVTVYDVTDLQVDTVKTIRGLDTTETYIITYSKEQK
jgi:hypothetical protein